jgi:hypothetical protein
VQQQIEASQLLYAFASHSGRDMLGRICSDQGADLSCDNVTIKAMRLMAASSQRSYVSITLEAVIPPLIRSINPKRHFHHIRPVVIHELRPLMTLWHIECNDAIYCIAGLHSASREHTYAGSLNRATATPSTAPLESLIWKFSGLIRVAGASIFSTVTLKPKN